MTEFCKLLDITWLPKKTIFTDKYGFHILDLFSTYPVGHVVSVRLPVVVVEDHDGGDHTGGHHEHDAVEVGPWTKMGLDH